MWTDTHAHLDDFIRAGEVDAVLERARDADVTRVLAVGGAPESNEQALALAARYPANVAAAVGYDRESATRRPALASLCSALADGRAIAVGEIGLDYHRGLDTMAAQKTLLETMLDLAAEFRAPIILHTRQAERDTREMLAAHVRDARVMTDRPGVAHCFTGEWPWARDLLNLGFYLGISGIVTFRNAETLRDIVRRAPADRLLMETDSPYLAPVPFRGRRNEPALLTHTALYVAQCRGCSPEEWARQTTANAGKLFGWPRLKLEQGH